MSGSVKTVCKTFPMASMLKPIVVSQKAPLAYLLKKKQKK